MSALQELASLKNKTSHLSERRHQESEEELIFGTLCLEKFESTGFQDADLLKEGCKRFIHAITLNSKDIRPHLGLIYLFTLIEDFDTAQIYIASAQSLEPDNPFLEAMQTFWREAKKASQSSKMSEQAYVVKTPDKKHIDLDALYDKVEDYIQGLVMELSQMSPPQATTQKDRLKQMSVSRKQLQASHEKILSDIALIDREIETDELRQALRPLEITLQRLQQNLEVSKVMLGIYRELQEQIKVVRQVAAEAQSTQELSDISVLEENAEVLLDRCDQFADQLDDLENQSVNMDELLKSYHILVHEIEVFQDVIDETIERLKG